MKGLIENGISKLFDSTEISHILPVEIIIGQKNFNDDNACSNCNKILWHTNCDYTTFKLSTSSPIYFANIEAFLNSFRKMAGKRCDLLFYDDRKIVFVDMYCGNSVYLYDHLVNGQMEHGKIAKVRHQIDATIMLLCSVPEIESAIKTFIVKEGVCAYRSKDEEIFTNVPKSINKSMSAFLRMTKLQEQRRIATPLSHGFVFITNKYDNIYQW